jgi:hypothetical protein
MENFTSYTEFKKVVLGQNIQRAKIELTDIIIEDRNSIKYKGQTLTMEDRAFTDLATNLGINQSIISNIESAVDEKFASNVINLMKSAKVKAGKSSMALYYDSNSKKIVNFKKTLDKSLSNGAMLNLFENVMDSHKGMEIKNMSVNSGGTMEITTVNNNWEFEPNRMSDEKFKGGLVFFNSVDKAYLAPFNERLVCLNGMITNSSDVLVQLGGNKSASNVEAFFNVAKSVNFDEYFAGGFRAQVNKAIETTASYAEVQAMYNKVWSELRQDFKEDVNTAHIFESQIPLMYIKSEYLKHKIDLDSDKVSRTDWSRAKTCMTVWDLVNAITYLATHGDQTGLAFRNGSESIMALQRLAGGLLNKKTFDLGTNFPNVF